MVDFIDRHSGWLFVLGVASLLLLPCFLQRGMFLDGVTYAGIASMLSDGIGTYAQPFYTHYLGASFYEHLPLGFMIQSWCFDLFGQHYWVERLSCLILFGLTIPGLTFIWRDLGLDKRGANWPVLLFVSIPIVFWSYRENTLEVPMTFWAVWAIALSIRAAQSYRAAPAVAAGLLTLAAVSSKGPTGAFPLAAISLYFMTIGKFEKRSLGVALVPVVTFVVVGSFLYQVDSIQIYVHKYLEQQLLPSLRGEREITSDHRYDILLDLLSEVAVPLGLAMLIYAVNRRTDRLRQIDKRKALFLLLIGLSAALPLMISLKQRRFYLLPALPYFALSIAAISYPYVHALVANLPSWSRRLSAILGLLLIVGSTIWMRLQAGSTMRDHELIHDCIALRDQVSEGDLISADHALCNQWIVHAYLARYTRVSLTRDRQQAKQLSSEPLPEGCDWKGRIFCLNQ